MNMQPTLVLGKANTYSAAKETLPFCQSLLFIETSDIQYVKYN